jgi:16S rRNA C967 or C1407 C5-methylase (RsmB/RsmF family)
VENTWQNWTLTLVSAAVALLLATGNGHVVIDVVAATGVATAEGLTWLLAQGAAS